MLSHVLPFYGLKPKFNVFIRQDDILGKIVGKIIRMLRTSDAMSCSELIRP